MSSQRSGQPVREPRRLRPAWKVGGLRRRPQQWLHQLVALERPANHRDGEGQSNDAVHLSRRSRRRRRRASGEGRPAAVARGIILERFLPERNRLSEILAKGNPRSDPRSIQEGSSGTAATANTDLQGAVKSESCSLPLVPPIALPRAQHARRPQDETLVSAAGWPKDCCPQRKETPLAFSFWHTTSRAVAPAFTRVRSFSERS